MLLKEFAENTARLLPQGQHVLAAVSGGADSVCMLHLLHRIAPLYNLRLSCAHVNHGLRESAARDETFVRTLCAQWDIPFFLHRADVAAEAKKQGVSVETAGRMVRYAYFKSIAQDAVIATAHQKDDAAESILLHLLRGSGLSGLCGIPEKRADGVIRPMLCFTRTQITDYLRAHALAWCEDETNGDTRYLRNKLRLEVLPKLKEINPSFVETAVRMADILQTEDDYMRNAAAEYGGIEVKNGAVCIDIGVLQSAPPAMARRIADEALKGVSPTPSLADVEKILALVAMQNGKVATLAGNIRAWREYNAIALTTDTAPQPFCVPLPQSGSVRAGAYRVTVGQGRLKLRQGTYSLRSRRPGDAFEPEGMTGTKSVKEFLSDAKIPLRLRDTIPLVVCGDRIAAVGDLRRCRAFVPLADEAKISIEMCNVLERGYTDEECD